MADERGATAASAQGVTKRFGDTTALDGVTVAVPLGAVVALLGPNGAGKTTLVSLLTGTRRADGGRVELFGEDPRHWRARRRLGVVPQEISFPHLLRVREVIDLVRAHYADPVPTPELLHRFGLEAEAGREVARLSSGQRRRLAVALAFAGRPALLVLDEPTAGLDLQLRRIFWQELRAHVASGGSILLTTHYLEEAEALADHVVLLHRGRVLASGTVSEVKASVERSRQALSAGAAEVRPLSLEDAVLHLLEEAS
ncbi:MAG: ABC transporter ATP-binding protein [Armatimonadota bacterium]|nr:ABC transporter ATP-binding protein [Armatimonadota bacterium]MDR7451303.1 ABC transporter ATP-binding protein [Armatimonadota bacterium]MDR7466794.1 ABC transporter ATP-binding protein [Armatimonadota bacterium]MDR7492733.1 ABC transporter ATP-binding protein [Armatimonadota bacterium]MDR7498509.1 ABC transporter ATP-binding protein [Armatimonadota bacterium]